MLVEASGGSIIRCLGKAGINTTNEYYLDPEVIHSGLTNCGSSEISGRTNLKNYSIEEKVKHNAYADWTCYLPDGTIKEYRRSYKKEDAMNATQEKHPNGTKIEYEFHKGYSHQDEGSIKTIIAKGKRELSSLRFDIDKSNHRGSVTSSNGKKVAFSYFKKDGQEYIEDIESTENPKMRFHYTKAGHHYCIDRITWPNERFLEVEYDNKGRVTCQKAPVGPDGEKRTIWHFSYHPDDHSTKVHDAYDHKRVYRYKNKRLSAVEEYNKKDKLYRTKGYFWGEKKAFHGASIPKLTKAISLLPRFWIAMTKLTSCINFIMMTMATSLKKPSMATCLAKKRKAFLLALMASPGIQVSSTTANATATPKIAYIAH